jgi:hypothetical protein
MADEGVSDIFRQFDSWKDRWPDMEEGVELLDRIFLNYVIRKNQTVPFFDDRGRPQARTRYVVSVLLQSWSVVIRIVAAVLAGLKYVLYWSA